MSKRTIYDKMIQDKEFERLMAQEDLILEVTESFDDILKTEKVKKSTLAEMMGKTKGFVSQLLNGGRNLTLRTMSDMAFHLGYKVEFNVHKRIKMDQRNTLQVVWKVNREGHTQINEMNIPDDYNGPPSCNLTGTRIAV